MVDKCTTMVANQIVSSGSIAVDSSNVVSRMNKTSSSERANKKEHPLTENDDNNGTMVHTCNECGKSVNKIRSLNGHKGIHWWEEYKHMRMMVEQRPIDAMVHKCAMVANQIVSSGSFPVDSRMVCPEWIWLVFLKKLIK